jgi:hypothetical protein
MKRSAVFLLLALGFQGCTIVGHERVAGWPQLAVYEHYVPEAQLRDRCSQYVGFGMSPQACAEFDFSRSRCDLWFSAEFPPTRSMIEHERLHCQGYDHVGMRTMEGLLARYYGAGSASTGATRR